MKPDPHQQSGGSSEEDDKLEEAIGFYSYHHAMHGPDFTAAATPQILNPNYSIPGKKSPVAELDTEKFQKITLTHNQNWVAQITIAARLNNEKIEALNGNDEALRNIVYTALQYTSLLGKFAETNPELLKPYAEIQATWPMLTSTSPRDNRANVGILKAIGLGQSTASERARGYSSTGVCTREAKDLVEFARTLHSIHRIIDKIDWDKDLADTALQQKKPHAPTVFDIWKTKNPMLPSHGEMLEAQKKRLPPKWLAALKRVLAKANSRASKKGGITSKSPIVNGVIPELSSGSFHIWKKFLRLVWLELYDGTPETNAELREFGHYRDDDFHVEEASKRPPPKPSSKVRDGIWARIIHSIENQIFGTIKKRERNDKKALTATTQTKAPPAKGATSQAKAHPPKSATEGTKPNKKTPGTS